MSIYNIEFEKQLLAGLLQYPAIYADIGPFINESDFSRTNKMIFNIIANLIKETNSVNKIVAIERLKSLNITIPDLDVASYIEALSMIVVDERSMLDLAKELKLVTIRRELSETGQTLDKAMRKGSFSDFDQIIRAADEIYNKKINLYHHDQNVVDIFGSIDDLMSQSDANLFKELNCPYAAFQKYYGGFRPGNVYCFASRSGQGKSTILMDIAYKTANIVNKNVKVLYLDTEMFTREVTPRLIASLSGVPFWHIDSGRYRQNAEYLAKVEGAKKTIKEHNYHFFHKHVGNINLTALISLIKRWYLKECGRGEKALIVYDYLKILEADRGGNMKEYELMGDKMDALKTCAKELDAPLLTAVQINRTGVTANRPVRELVDDESVISISDRIQWFTSYMSIFRRKVPEEIEADGIARGTHKMIVLKTRTQGEFATGHHDLVRIVDQERNRVRYVNNFINFNIDNFHVEERGSLRDYVNRAIPIQENPQAAEQPLL